jgi:hypothetical protein
MVFDHQNIRSRMPPTWSLDSRLNKSETQSRGLFANPTTTTGPPPPPASQIRPAVVVLLVRPCGGEIPRRPALDSVERIVEDFAMDLAINPFSSGTRLR